MPSRDGPGSSTERSKQAVHPLRIISAADSAALRYLSSTPRERVLAPPPERNISSETLSSTAPRLSAPCECVCALTRPGIKKRSDADISSASSETSKPGCSMAVMRPSSISKSCSVARPRWSPWPPSTSPPRMTVRRPVMIPRRHQVRNQAVRRVQSASSIVLSRCGDDPVQDFVQDRHRRCEVEPDKLWAIRIEGLAGTESDPGLVEKELECRGRKPKLAAVEPCEIGGLRGVEADGRRFGAEHIHDPVSRLQEMRHHRVEPRLTFSPGGGRCVGADDISLPRESERDALVKPVAQRFIAEGHDRATKAGNIEALGRRVDGHGARGDIRPERGKGNVLVPWIDEVGVDLVGDDDEIVFDGKLAQRKQLVA